MSVAIAFQLKEQISNKQKKKETNSSIRESGMESSDTDGIRV